jgi:hypothetical protein
MTTKPPLQKILQGILHTENESKKKQKTKKQNKKHHERTGSTKPQEKTRNQRVTLI